MLAWSLSVSIISITLQPSTNLAADGEVHNKLTTDFPYQRTQVLRTSPVQKAEAPLGMILRYLFYCVIYQKKDILYYALEICRTVFLVLI